MKIEVNPIDRPRIRKAKLLRGKTLEFRDATESDAEFILSLRTDSVKSRFLSATSSDVEEQRAWLRRYAVLDDQAYFIIESAGKPIGTVRLYDAQGESFCWGSWILVADAPKVAAIESALMVYAYSIDHLQFRGAHFEVRKGNQGVWEFHERFGAVRYQEAPEEYLYKISLADIQKSRSRYARYLPDGVA